MEHILQITLPETNIAPENGYLEDEFPAFLLGARTSVEWKNSSDWNPLTPRENERMSPKERPCF